MARRDTTRPFLRKLHQVLDTMPAEASQRAFEEGELYICSTCNLLLKPCQRHGGARCTSMIRGSTHLEIMESSIHDALAAERLCLRCGAALPKRLLQRNPSRELCPACSPTSPRKRRRKPSPGASL